MSAETCPVCSEPQLISLQSGVLKCQFCHAQIINGRLICPSCKRANDIGLEQCSVCGEPLTVVGAVISRQSTGFGSQRLEQLKVQASDMKAHAEKHSQERMTVFKDVDQRRIQSEREAATQQHLRDRTVLKYTAIGAGAFLFLVAIISLVILL
jgi:hypothetical protein